MADGADAWAQHLPEELVRKFAAARRRLRKVVVAKGWTLVIFAACVSFAMCILLDRLLFLRSPHRLVLFIVSIGAMGSFLVAFLIMPLLKRVSARRIARSVEDKHPSLGDLLLSTVELSEQLARGEVFTSRELIGAVSRETAKRARKIDFRSAVPFSAVKKPLLLTLGVAGAVGVYCYLRPMIAANVLQRMLHPYSGPPALTFTQLSVLPGDALVPTGTDVEIRAIAAGKIPNKATLHLRREGGRWAAVSLAKEKGGEFRYLVRALLGTLSYRVNAGDARSPTHRIFVSDRPVIVGIEVDYTYPEYTGRLPETKRDSGDVVAVRGSRVQITARSNKRLESASLRFGDGTQSLVSIRGSTIRSQVFELKRDDTYSFELRDSDGFANQEAISYSIRSVEDKAPVVGITRPDRYSDATPDEVVEVRFRAVDDFGIEKASLEYVVRSGEPKEEKDKVPGDERKGTIAIELAAKGKLELEDKCELSLPEVDAKVGEVVAFRIVAEDNNVLTGPGKGSSAEHTIRVVSNETSLRRIEQEQQDLARRLLRLINQQKDNNALVNKLSESLKAKEAPSDAEKSSLEAAKSVQRVIEQSGGELARDFAGMLEKMRLNPMIQARTAIEMSDVTEALKSVSRNEMPEASLKASEAVRSKQRQEREKKLAETAALQEKIIEALENIGREFAQFQDEQRLLTLAETAGKLAQEQLAARSQTAAALPELSGVFPEKLTEEQKRRLKKLVDAQEKLREKVAEFEQRLRTLRKQLEYSNSRDAQMVSSALKHFEEGGQTASASIPRSVSEAIDALRANHLNKGMSLQSQVYESLMKMAQEFQRTQTARLQGEFFNAAEGLQLQQPEIDKLIEIQKGIIAETERLPRETGEKPPEGAESAKFQNVTRSQNDLLRRTGNFRAILEDMLQNLVVTEMDPVTPLKGAESAMGKAAAELDKQKPAPALDDEKESLKNLEKARDELAKTLARMMANANLQQAMRAMSVIEKMVVEQKKVNDGTKELDKEASEKKAMTDPMLATLRQLVTQQESLQARAASLSNYLKTMLRTGEMMGESAGRLKSKQTGQQTQQVQSQILELLMQMLVRLQAEVSAMAQAMGLTGTSGTGARGGIPTEPIFGPAPGKIDDRWANLPPRVKQELLEAWTEKFSPEFRELIALYYKRLSGGEGPP